ncbi:MAG: carboxypeptidase-like regulatory domain-containing protein [Chthoniobacteraceae bacterium]
MRSLLYVFAIFCAVRVQAVGPVVPALTVTPGTIQNDYAGPIDLTITGLPSSGQTVLIEEFIDVDNSGTITALDFLVRKIRVTDGQVTSIAGHRNINVPGDEDGAADTQIQARLLFVNHASPDKIDATYIFRISAVTGTAFSPITATLTVTQKDYSGSGISGSVGVPGAIVLFQSGAVGDGDTVGVTRADALGNYSFKLPPGTYRPVATRPGFIFNAGAGPVVTVPAAGPFANQNLTLVPSTRTISGTMRDVNTLAGIPAVGLFATSQSGFISFSFSDGNGNFVIDANPGQWRFDAPQDSLAALGYLDFNVIDSASGNVTGFNYDLPPVTSLIYGSLKTAASVPLPFAIVGAEGSGSPYKSSAITDASGNYTLGVSAGSWRVVPDPSPSFLFQQQLTAVVGTNGSALLQNLLAYPITAHLRGQIRDNTGAIVPNLTIYAADMTGNIGDSVVVADGNGTFDIPVFGGGGTATREWFLGIQFSDNNPSNYVPTNVSFNVQDNVDINGIDYRVHVVTAHLFGQVLDENDAPIGNISIFGNLPPNGIYNAGATVDGGGNFDLPIFGGNWKLGLSNIFGLGIVPQDYPIAVTDGVNQSGLVFRVRHANFTITGSVKNNINVGIGGVDVTGTITLGGSSFSVTGTTDPGGNYSLPVFGSAPSNWSVGVDAAGLDQRGYQSVTTQAVFVGANVPGVNFVAIPIQSFGNWLTQNFTQAELQNPNVSGPNADPERDGVLNVLEYAFHLQPKSPDSSGLPFSGISTPGGPYLTITYRRLIGATDLQYLVQESPDLGGWTPATVIEEILSDDGTVQSVRAKVPMGSAELKFIRLMVTKTP